MRTELDRFGRIEFQIRPPGTARRRFGLIVQLTAESRPVAEISKIRYSHQDMIDFILLNPAISQGEIAIRYGYTESWVSQVMSSDAFRAALAARREEFVDPVLVATLEERFRALTNRSLDRLMEKLNAPQVSDGVVLKAVELGAKAMGIGGNAPPAPPPQDQLARLADRLIALQTNVRAGISSGVTYEHEVCS